MSETFRILPFQTKRCKTFQKSNPVESQVSSTELQDYKYKKSLKICRLLGESVVNSTKIQRRKNFPKLEVKNFYLTCNVINYEASDWSATEQQKKKAGK